MPLPPPTAVPSADDATADDLIFLLSIVGNPNRIIAEQEKKQQQLTQQQINGSSSSSSSSSRSKNTVKASTCGENNTPSEWWQSVLATLPSQRRQIIMALQELANTYHKWSSQHSLVANTNNDRIDDDRQASGNNSTAALEEIDALEKLEQIASNIREYITSYLEAMKDYKHAVQLFWINHIKSNSNDHANISQLSQIGYQLSLQLIKQLLWDEELAQTAIIQLLNEELYTPNNHESIIIHKLNTWANAMSSMIQIDKSFWKFVEREVYDETTELENNNNHDDNDDDTPQLLNGESSSQIVDLEMLLVKSIQHVEEQVGGTGTCCVDSCDDVSKQTLSLHEDILKSSSVEGAVKEFFNYSPSPQDESNKLSSLSSNTTTRKRRPPITSILVTGQEGCGKTHLLDTIQRQQRRQQQQQQQRRIKETDTAPEDHHHSSTDSVRIIRPKYPVDLVGSSIGSSEDRLIALFSYAYDIISTWKNTSSSSSSSTGKYTKCLVMLDDVDKLLSLSDDTHNTGGGLSESSSTTHSAHYFVGRRCKALYLSILDSLRDKYSNNNGHILLLCTSRIRCDEIVSRFDKVFVKREPDDEQRREMILSCLAADDDDVERSIELEQDTNELLSLIVHHATGKSAFEISQCCRKVLLTCAEASSSIGQCNSILRRRLECLDNIIQAAPPPSLRSGSLDGVVDMKVLTPDELESRILHDSDGQITLPLFGSDAKRAYESLMNVVITPLCRSNEIVELLYGGNTADTDGCSKQKHAKPIRVGALLIGGPGVGKTSLAYHCASVAATMARGVTLLDVSCTSLIHKELGGSERAVQQLFSAVRAAAPCILLLDGIENIAPCRGNDNTSEGTMDRVLSMFLTEMDGIETGKPSGNVAVIGITYDANLIDPSLCRPGRLEKTIPLGMPDTEARKELVRREIRSMNLDFTSADYFDPKNEEELSKFVAIESAGMSAVEVIAICKEASMECLREVKFIVTNPTEPPSLRYKHFKCAVNKMKGRER